MRRKRQKVVEEIEEVAGGVEEKIAVESIAEEVAEKMEMKVRSAKVVINKGLDASFINRMQEARQTRKYVGVHVSAAGGAHFAVKNAREMGCASFALFLRSQRQWNAKPLEPELAKVFAADRSASDYGMPLQVLPHGSYLVNLASPDPVMLAKSRANFVEDLQRCEQLGITLYNFHPGSTKGEMLREKGIAQMAEELNHAHRQTKSVVTVIENMAGGANQIGCEFEDLARVIALVHDKNRVGVCLDTAHLFGYGYDVSSADKFDAVLKDFDARVGLKYLRAMHLNDSKAPLGSKKDRHENLGKGEIGLECFRFVMNDDRFNDIPLILETPERGPDLYMSEVNMLYSFVKK